MMFLIRAAFWLSLVLLILPGDPASGTDAPRVSLFQALGAAQGIARDVSGFCDRNPEVCATGGSAAAVLGEKARYAYRLVRDYMDGGSRPAAEEQPAARLRGTLTGEDVAVPWHGVKKASQG
jgi:hypothetical protein